MQAIACRSFEEDCVCCVEEMGTWEIWVLEQSFASESSRVPHDLDSAELSAKSAWTSRLLSVVQVSIKVLAPSLVFRVARHFAGSRQAAAPAPTVFQALAPALGWKSPEPRADHLMKMDEAMRTGCWRSTDRCQTRSRRPEYSDVAIRVTAKDWCW